MIIHCSCDNNISCGDSNGDSMFLKVFRNVYIKKIIFQHLQLFNKHNKVLEFKVDELIEYEHRDYITSLYIKDNNRNIPKNGIPLSVCELRFGDSFNQPLRADSLPISLNKLYFGQHFDQPIKKFKENLELIEFGDCFNQPLAILPESLTYLDLGESFNLPIKVCFPTNLKHLSFSSAFNHPIHNDQGISFLPKNLIHLNMGESFNHILLKNCFPSTLKYLRFGFHFNQLLPKKCLPQGLETLIFGQLHNQKIKHLPSSLTLLECGQRFNKPLKKGTLPPNLQWLKLGDAPTVLEVGSIPPKVIGLTVNIDLKKSKKGCLPSSITSLHLVGCNKPSGFPIGIIPHSVACLTLGENFNEPLELSKGISAIPNSVTSLVLGQRFNQPLLAGTIPYGVKTLVIGECFNQPIEEHSLPLSITTLTLKCKFYFHRFSSSNLPKSITTLYYTNDKIYDVLNLNDFIDHSNFKVIKI